MIRGINFEKWLVRTLCEIRATNEACLHRVGFPDNTLLSLRLIKRTMIAY